MGFCCQSHSLENLVCFGKTCSLQLSQLDSKHNFNTVLRILAVVKYAIGYVFQLLAAWV